MSHKELEHLISWSMGFVGEGTGLKLYTLRIVAYKQFYTTFYKLCNTFGNKYVKINKYELIYLQYTFYPSLSNAGDERLEK